MSGHVPFSAGDFRRRVAERLQPERREVAGDHSFDAGIGESFMRMQRRPAAVLVPVVQREPEATLLLTQRVGGLRAHAGQIAFPGGRIDESDAGAEAAALREAEEEVGLVPDFVETLCRGPDYLTGSGYHIATVIGIVRPGFRLRLNPAEVADAFEVPLSFLMDPANHGRGSRIWQGATRTFFEMPYGERHIWGITAGILRILYERLYHEQAEAAQ